MLYMFYFKFLQQRMTHAINKWQHVLPLFRCFYVCYEFIQNDIRKSSNFQNLKHNNVKNT